MKKLSNRLQKITLNTEKLDKNFTYSPIEAISFLKRTASTKFIESTEVHVALNIDTKYSDQQLRTTLILPNGTGKEKTLAVLLPEEKITEEIKQSADIVGSEDLTELISKGEINFDVLLTIPSMMAKIAKLGRILGPKGLMPSPKAGTVTDDITNAIEEFKKGKIEYRADKTGIVHLSFGKVSFTEEELLENLKTVYKSILQNRPSGVKGKYFKSFYVCNTMGPSIKVELSDFEI